MSVAVDRADDATFEALRPTSAEAERAAAGDDVEGFGVDTSRASWKVGDEPEPTDGATCAGVAVAGAGASGAFFFVSAKPPPNGLATAAAPL